MATELTWQHDMNRVNGGSLHAKNVNTYHLWYVYAFLTGKVGGATQGLWTLAGSSTGVTAGMDATERLGATYDPSKWVRSTAEGTAHTWFALRAPFQDGDKDVHLICSYVGSSDHFTRWHFTSGVLSGGTLTDAPTAEQVWGGRNGSGGMTEQLSDSSVSVGWRLHGSLSTTGEFHVHGSKDDSGKFSWTMLIHRTTDRLDNVTYDPVNGRDRAPWGFVGYTSPVPSPLKHLIAAAPAASHTVSSSICIGTTATYLGTGSQGARMPDRDHSETMAAIGSWCFQQNSSTSYAETFNSNALSATSDRAKLPNGEWITFPCYLFSGAQTSNNANVRFDGRCPDLFQVNKSCVDGDVFPASGPIEYVVVGSFLLPGNAEPQL